MAKSVVASSVKDEESVLDVAHSLQSADNNALRTADDHDITTTHTDVHAHDNDNAHVHTTNSQSLPNTQETDEQKELHHREPEVSQRLLKTIVDKLSMPSLHDATAASSNNATHQPAVDSQQPEEKKENAPEKAPTTTTTALRVECGHVSKQGIRPTMEDQTVIESSFTVVGSKCTSGHLSLYAVFDGHGGKQCAEYCATNLCSTLRPYLSSSESVPMAFHLAIAELDANVIKQAEDASGSTGCIVLIDTRTFDVWCCNVGDSRCILINQQYSGVKQLSIEHKPDNALEKQRILSAGGWVTFGRVCGILAVSRSLGDKDFKDEIENLIVSTPDVTHHKLVANQDKYIILACDGLYDVFSNEQCMKWLHSHTDGEAHNDSMQSVTEQLAYDSIYVRRTKDNVSILILRLDAYPSKLQESSDEQHEVTSGDDQVAMADEHDDDVDVDKMYHSTSSSTAVSTSLSPHEATIDSIQSESKEQALANDDQPAETESQTQSQSQSLHRHKFHVVMASDDGLTECINEEEQQNIIDMIDNSNGIESTN